MRYRLTPVRMIITKKSTNNREFLSWHTGNKSDYYSWGCRFNPWLCSVGWHCHELWCRSQTQLGSSIAVAVVQAGSCSSSLTPSLGTSICFGCGPKKQKKKKKRLQITNVGGGVEIREPSQTIGRNVNWCSYYGKQCGRSKES